MTGDLSQETDKSQSYNIVSMTFSNGRKSSSHLIKCVFKFSYHTQEMLLFINTNNRNKSRYYGNVVRTITDSLYIYTTENLPWIIMGNILESVALLSKTSVTIKT